MSPANDPSELIEWNFPCDCNRPDARRGRHTSSCQLQIARDALDELEAVYVLVPKEQHTGYPQQVF